VLAGLALVCVKVEQMRGATLLAATAMWGVCTLDKGCLLRDKLMAEYVLTRRGQSHSCLLKAVL
jgi:hypothetical protein